MYKLINDGTDMKCRLGSLKLQISKQKLGKKKVLSCTRRRVYFAAASHIYKIRVKTIVTSYSKSARLLTSNNKKSFN